MCDVGDMGEKGCVTHVTSAARPACRESWMIAPYRTAWYSTHMAQAMHVFTHCPGTDGGAPSCDSYKCIKLYEKGVVFEIHIDL